MARTRSNVAWLSMLMASVGIGRAATRTSADYGLTHEAVSASAGASTSADYAQRGSLGEIGGVAEADAGRVWSGAGYLPRAVSWVSGRHVFYNQSVWDGNDAAAGPADDAAIATDKLPLLPGGDATFANYTSYSRGLNGLMVDVTELGGVPGAADLGFAGGNDGFPAGWSAAPTPSISVRWGAGVGGADRVTLIWASGLLRRTWLETTVRADDLTGLGRKDVFYFGNSPGETGNDPLSATVTSTDSLRVLGHVSATAGIENAFDINRDGKVGATDRLVVLANLSSIAPLALIQLSSGGALMAASAPSPTGSWQGEVRADPTGLALSWTHDGAPVRVWTATNPAASLWELYDEVGRGRASGERLEVSLPVDRADASRVYRLESLSRHVVAGGASSDTP